MKKISTKPEDLIVTEYRRGGKIIEHTLPAITPELLDRCFASAIFKLMEGVKSKVVKRKRKVKK